MANGKASFRGRAIVKMKYTKNLKAAKAHIQYIAFRSREIDEKTKGVFSEKDDHASVKEFQDKLNDPATKHHSRVKLHKLTISFKQEWYDRYNIDYKDLTRHVMKYLEEKKGMKLEWVAAQHLKEGHPHAHVAIKSCGKDSFTGKTKHLKLSKEDFKDIQNEIDRYTGREQHLEMERQQRREMQQDRFEGSIIGQICKEIDKHVKQQQREGERLNEQARRKSQREENRER